jgi:hypothetical protein
LIQDQAQPRNLESKIHLFAIRLFQILIPQLHFGDFFNTIDPQATSAGLKFRSAESPAVVASENFIHRPRGWQQLRGLKPRRLCGMSPPGLVGPSEVEAQPPHPAGPSSTGQVLALTLVAPNVLLAGEAEAGIETRAIPEERIKAMRRMGKPRVVDGAFANLDELNMPPNDQSFQ